MELILRVIEGAYAYLLIFQILVVTSLILSFIWLVTKRMREKKNFSVMAEADGALQRENEELRNKIIALQNEPKSDEIVSHSVKEANEKVKYLENKLLEYEILQEEISTLSNLKMENEKLKVKLVQLEGKLPAKNDVEMTEDVANLLQNIENQATEPVTREAHSNLPVVESEEPSKEETREELPPIQKEGDENNKAYFFESNPLENIAKEMQSNEQKDMPKEGDLSANQISATEIEGLLSQIEELTNTQSKSS